MKHEKLLSCLLGGLYAFILSAAGVACVVTGFGFPDADLAIVLTWCALCSILFPMAYTLKKQLLCAALLALAAGFLWRWGSLSLSVEVLLNRLSRIWGWEEIAWSGRDLEVGDITMALCAMGTLCAFMTARAICGRRSAFPAVVSAALPLSVCLVIPETVPETAWLFLLMLGLSLLIVPQSLRRRSGRQANRLTGMVIVPAALMLGLLFLLVPQDTYDKQSTAAQIVTNLKNWLDPEDTVLSEGGKNIRVGGGAVELTKLGNRSRSEREIMTVTSDQGGTLYLRTCSYDTYYADIWTNLAVPNILSWPDESLLESAGTVRISTSYALDMIVFPYYPEGDMLDSLSRGINNYANKTEYEYEVMVLTDNYLDYARKGPVGVTDYTQLPTDTYTWAKNRLSEILTEGLTISEKAETIAAYVSESAQYSLYPGKMPDEAEGFVQWFLEESDTGYCVHFATATAVLLRAAGIPARYVTGYLVSTRPGVETVVYEKNAHAWVEYWLPGVGWIMLESTPASALDEQIAPPVTAPVTVTREETEESGFNWWLLLALVPLLMAALILQWQIRLELRRKRTETGTDSERAAGIWQEIVLLTQYCDYRPDSAVFDLVQKAVYSRYGVTEEEMSAIEQALADAQLQLRRVKWYKKPRYRLILALY